MFTITVYREVLRKILDFITNSRQESVDEVQSVLQVTSIIFTEEEMRVVSVLVDEGDLEIMSVHSQLIGNRFATSGKLIPNGALVVEVDLSDEDSENKIRTRLSDLDSWLNEYSSVFGDVSDGRTIETGRHQGFVSYGSGLITFNGKLVILPRREAYLLAHLINNAGQLVYATEIVDEFYSGDSTDNNMTICSKIISPLNAKLAKLTGTQRAIKTIDAQEGYVLDLS